MLVPYLALRASHVLSPSLLGTACAITVGLNLALATNLSSLVGATALTLEHAAFSTSDVESMRSLSRVLGLLDAVATPAWIVLLAAVLEPLLPGVVVVSWIAAAILLAVGLASSLLDILLEWRSRKSRST